ncbi:MAG: hypothetical protein JW904_06485 [Spirochaetales bacterium]|nr:hypothetical protein [Spirochaetales bacterium]
MDNHQFKPGTIHYLLLTAACALLFFTACNREPSPAIADTSQSSAGPYRILHIMSYHSPWVWTDDQFAGFKEGLNLTNVEYKVHQMDTFGKDDPQLLKLAGKRARDMIESWKPDLVYTSDDYAQKYVATYYLNSSIPFVFSGVNQDPSEYGFDTANNVTGVLERLHIVETISLLKKTIPKTKLKTIAVILDNNISYEGVLEDMKKKITEFPELDFSIWKTIETFSDFKKTIKDLHGKADALCIIGISQFKDEQGKSVGYTELLRWVAENSKIPDFSFWEDRSSYGILCTVSVSALEQGRVAGKIAQQILAEKKSPKDIPVLATSKGKAIINLRRIKDLGIPYPPAGVLLSSMVIEKYNWEQ